MRESHPIDTSNFDTSVKPTDDFFRFVNGNWLKNNPIPEDESRWGSFSMLRVEVEEKLKKILDELIKTNTPPSEPETKKILDFYQTAMNTAKLNELGIKPLEELFCMIASIKDTDELARVTSHLHKYGVDVWWMPSVEQDEKKSEVMSLHFHQGGLGLPDRDYYTKSDEKSQEIRGKYLKHVATLLQYSASDTQDHSASARIVMDIETCLAKSSMTRVERRDAEKQYNKMTLEELGKKTPSIDWKTYFEELPTPKIEYLIVGQPIFFGEADHLFKTLPLEHIKIYLRWHVVNAMAPYLGEDLEKENFDFYGRVFGGAAEMKPRWRRVLTVLNSTLDHPMGKLYVEQHFSEEAKKKVSNLVDHLVAAYRARIERLDWMGPETKKKALEKLGTISKKLGYPGTWKDFKALEIKTDSYAQNYMRAYAFAFDREIRKIGKPVDRDEWHMPPQTVNAYYSPTMNEIVFPAAILQAPFFDPNADDAVNFGGIGGVIGHELTHGFDDQGSRFDAKGNLEEWWTSEDKERFEKKTLRLAEQFDTYEPLPNTHINGRLTLGENIADLGGMLIAYDGLCLNLEEKANEKIIDELTPYQRFFVNWAIVERGHEREEFLRTQLQIDPHAPSYYRVNGPASNLPEFYDAFECKKGDRLWRDPEDRVKIW